MHSQDNLFNLLKMTLVTSNPFLKSRLKKKEIMNFIPIFFVRLKENKSFLIIGDYSKNTSMVKMAHDIIKENFTKFSNQNPENIFTLMENDFNNGDFEISYDYELLKDDNVEDFTSLPRIWLNEADFFNKLQFGL